jgi:ribose transport system permease protein
MTQTHAPIAESGTTTGDDRPAPHASTDRSLRLLERLVHQREIGVITALLALCVFGALGTDGFASKDNLLNVGQQASLIGIMAVGMTFVIISGEIDLSVGSIYVLSSMTCGMLLQDGANWVLALLVGVGVGAAAGAVNGLLTVLLKLPSFIVTLGTLSVFRGATLLLTDAAPISLDQRDPNISSFSFIGSGKVFGVPMQLIIMLVTVALGGLLLRFTKFGFHVYAVGGSREAARLCGIPTARIRVLAFTLLGALSGLAGIIGLSFLRYVQGTTGTGLELLVITAVIIGSAALFGGSGTMLGTLVGVLLIATLQNVLILSGIASFWQTVVIGVVIIVSVAFDTWVRQNAARS